MDIEKLTAFATLQFLFAITPGPAVLLVATHASRSGMLAGIKAALGVQAGNAFYLALSALGLSVALARIPGAFLVIQLLGAAYLATIGIRGLLSTFRPQAEGASTAPRLTDAPFVQGAVKQLANPKSSLFFVALLPQFMTPGTGIALQATVLALIATAIELPILCGYSLLAASGQTLLADPARALWRDRFSALALLAIAGWIFREALTLPVLA